MCYFFSKVFLNLNTEARPTGKCTFDNVCAKSSFALLSYIVGGLHQIIVHFVAKV